MNEELKFHLPIATLLREGNLITTADENNTGLNFRLADAPAAADTAGEKKTNPENPNGIGIIQISVAATATTLG